MGVVEGEVLVVGVVVQAQVLVGAVDFREEEDEDEVLPGVGSGEIAADGADLGADLAGTVVEAEALLAVDEVVLEAFEFNILLNICKHLRPAVLTWRLLQVLVLHHTCT